MASITDIEVIYAHLKARFSRLAEGGSLLDHENLKEVARYAMAWLQGDTGEKKEKERSTGGKRLNGFADAERKGSMEPTARAENFRKE